MAGEARRCVINPAAAVYNNFQAMISAAVTRFQCNSMDK